MRFAFLILLCGISFAETSETISVKHLQWTSPKPFFEVTSKIETQLGRFDPSIVKVLEQRNLAVTAPLEEKIKAMAGSSGFMLFDKQDHGALLTLRKKPRQALQLVVGNPLIAVKMTAYDIRAGLYAPLRIFVYTNESQQTVVESDLPSSLFGQFKNEAVTTVALDLDQKLKNLVETALR